MMKCRSITGIDTTSEPAPGPQLPVGPFLPTENRKSTVSIENLGMEDLEGCVPILNSLLTNTKEICQRFTCCYIRPHGDKVDCI